MDCHAVTTAQKPTNELLNILHCKCLYHDPSPYFFANLI